MHGYGSVWSYIDYFVSHFTNCHNCVEHCTHHTPVSDGRVASSDFPHTSQPTDGSHASISYRKASKGFPAGLSREAWVALILQLPVVVLLIDALVGAGGGALLLELLANGAVELLFEDGLGLNGLKLGLEVLELVGGGVAATAGVVHVVGHVFDFIAVTAPDKC